MSEIIELDESWNKVLEFLKDSETTLESHAPPQNFIWYVEVLMNHNMFNVLHEYLIDETKQQINLQFNKVFWENFQLPIPDSLVEDTIINSFNTLTNQIMSCFNSLFKFHGLNGFCNSVVIDAEKLKENFVQMINPILRGVVFFMTTIHYRRALKFFLKNFFSVSDLIFCKKDNSESHTCPCCSQLNQCCTCRSTYFKYIHFFELLKNLGIIELIIAGPLLGLIFDKIEEYIQSQCKLSFDKNYIQSIFNWVDELIINWPDEILLELFEKHSLSIRFVCNYTDKFKHYASKIYGKIRINQIFDIIIEYPDSLPVLMDLVKCLKLVPELKMILVSSLKQALKVRLLHPGVNTGDILTAYISTMRALRVLDQSGIFLEMVGEPVKQYLKSRDDTVRCIVTSLTEDNNNELSEELNKGYLLADSDSEDEMSCLFNWETWNPDPVEAEPLKPSQASRSFDIISMLVNIYGSKELFIEEYRSLLADRILTQLSYDTVKEIRHLELLKLRFGDNQLHHCEIMLKDVTDSRRINTQIKDRKPTDTESDVIPINGMILSAQFWPPWLKDENVKLPDCLIDSMHHYKKSFELLKGNRTLIWKPHLGLVNMEVELKGKVLSFNVSPVHAAIMWHFQSKSAYTVDELCAIMQMPAHALQRKIAFWQSQGLLKEDGIDRFKLAEEFKNTYPDAMSIDEDIVESALISSKDQKEEELQIIWSYIVGMLTNLESLTLERIHAMLKMFAMQGSGSQCSLQDLKAILELKIKELKLVYSNGVYRLPPN